MFPFLCRTSLLLHWLVLLMDTTHIKPGPPWRIRGAVPCMCTRCLTTALLPGEPIWTILGLLQICTRTLPNRRLLLLLLLIQTLPMKRHLSLKLIRLDKVPRRMPRIPGGSLWNISLFPGRNGCYTRLKEWGPNAAKVTKLPGLSIPLEQTKLFPELPLLGRLMCPCSTPPAPSWGTEHPPAIPGMRPTSFPRISLPFAVVPASTSLSILLLQPAPPTAIVTTPLPPSQNCLPLGPSLSRYLTWTRFAVGRLEYYLCPPLL